tara:strand:+ start:3662 stop:6154 length:2493 start_codon:yes stop_codon:yes gene_type:complete
MAEQSFYALLNEVSNDIAVIAESPTLRNYINTPSEKTARDVDRLFRATLENKTSYFQIRLIGVQDNGREVIRFDKSDTQVFKSDILQQKGDLDYFKQTVQIGKGEFYFSKINLNEEYGVISNPPTPTVRAASPIFNSAGQAVGVLVINVDLSKLYEAFKQISRGEHQLYLIDDNGQYLYGPEPDKWFGVQTQKEYAFYSDFDIGRDTHISKEKMLGQLNGLSDHKYLSYIRKLTYFQGKRDVYLVALIEQNLLLQSAKGVRSESLRILLWVCLCSILMSWFFTNFFSRKINRITKAIANYDKGVTDRMELPLNRKDEIGVLANTFVQMKTKIDSNVKDLNVALEKEQLAKKQRDEFLQNMSHEMRTPLNTILGLTQILYRQSPTDVQLPIINSLERSANNLAGLIYDVLDHQKLLERKVQIVSRPTNIAALLKDIHSSYEFEALQKGLVFQLDVDKELEVRLFETDPLRLSQIITNLVVNAVKYTEKGLINLTATISSKKGRLLQIKLKDTGVGILPENITKINERFFREEDELSGRYGGYGLGLSIVKQLVELFGGSIKAKSDKGVGSEFCVTIPLREAEVSQSRYGTTAKEFLLPRLLNRYNVLFIEDDLSTVDLIKHILADEKIELNHFDKWNDISESIEGNLPDLIISDLMLGEENLVMILKEWITTKKINCPLIIVSALEPKIMADLSTFNFQKPYDIAILKDCVYCILGSKEINAPNFSNLYNNYDADASKMIEVLKLLQSEFKTYLDRIEAVADSKDQKEWKAIQHKLIAHINSLGLTDLKGAMPDRIEVLKQDDLPKIYNLFAYYLCCFRFEEYLNSKDLSS